jgi:hypothetical protein
MTAQDAQTLREVLDDFESSGYQGHFAARENSQVECLACHQLVAAKDVGLDALRRLEGASDPDDMLAVGAVRCAHCGCLGTLILNYGPEATPEDTGVLLGLEDDRRGPGVEPNG